MDTHAISSAGVPVLCVDTCSILDIIRDPTRKTAKPNDQKAAIELVAAAEAGDLICLMAQQVATEFSDHDQAIQDEAERNLGKVREQVERISQLSAVFGSPSVVDLTHLDDYVARARKVVERWLTQIVKVTPSDSVPAKAFARMNACLAPARRGKESSKDCLIYETYIEVVTILRNAGVEAPIVFLSSNTTEYFTERTLKAEIESDFGKLNIKYAQNMSVAKHALGL